MTAGADGETIDGMSIDRVEQLIDSLKMRLISLIRPKGRTYLRKREKTSAWHTLFDDKLVQEVVRMILEAIYEGSLNILHMGFVPNEVVILLL